MDIRRLTPHDVPYCQALAADRGWLREDRRWALLMDTSDVYGIDDPDGGLAATVVLTRYGSSFAVIGMMLVAQRWGRQGLGQRLMKYALAEADGAVVMLTATEYGRPLYARLGFEPRGTMTHYTGQLPAAPARSRVATDADMAEIVEYDTKAFGADRSHLIGRLPGFGRLRRNAAGYGAAWHNGGTMIGPVVADDTDTAISLVRDLADGPVLLDIPSYQSELEAWTARHLDRSWSVTIMTYGGAPPGDTSRLYLPFSRATG